MTEERINFIRNFQENFVAPLQEHLEELPTEFPFPGWNDFGLCNDMFNAIKDLYVGLTESGLVQISFPYKCYRFRATMPGTTEEEAKFDAALGVITMIVELFITEFLMTSWLSPHVQTPAQESIDRYPFTELLSGLTCLAQIFTPCKYGEADKDFIKKYSKQKGEDC